MYLGF